jgi:hypothetical protein
MEQRAVIRLFALKGLKAKAIQAELESAYGTDASKLSTVRKRHLRFLHERTTVFDGPRSGRPRTNDLAGALRSILAEMPFTSCEVLCRHVRIVKTICLPILHDELGLQQFQFRIHYSSLSCRELVSNESLLVTSPGSCYTTLMTRAGQHLEMSFQKESPEN